LRGWAIRFGIVTAIALALGRAIEPRGVWAVAALGIGVIALYGAVMLPLALQPPLGPYVRGVMARLAAWLPGRTLELPGTPR
jgi:hypothetical protein